MIRPARLLSEDNRALGSMIVWPFVAGTSGRCRSAWRGSLGGMVIGSSRVGGTALKSLNGSGMSIDPDVVDEQSGGEHRRRGGIARPVTTDRQIQQDEEGV